MQGAALMIYRRAADTAQSAGRGGACSSPTETDFALQNQLHLCKAQTSLHSNFTWRSQTSPHRQVPAVPYHNFTAEQLHPFITTSLYYALSLCTRLLYSLTTLLT